MANNDREPIVTLTRGQLRDIMREVVDGAVEGFAEGAVAPRRYLNPDELCEHLGISRPKLRELVAEGCPILRVSDKIMRFEVGAVEEWLAGRQAPRKRRRKTG